MKLQLYYPCRPYFINQRFGRSGVPTYAAQGMKGHNGMDLTARNGDPVRASHDGLASFQIDSNGGNGVVVITDKPYDYEGGQSFFKTIYWHLCDSSKQPQYKSPIEDKTGAVPVKRGDIIGYADNTGLSTGDHLHFGLKPVAKGEDYGSWYNVAQNNGYYGAIDPEPYFIGRFADEGINETRFIFNRDMQYSQRNEDIRELQKRLGVNPTGFYGTDTQKAVYNFQLKNVPLSWYERFVLRGKKVGAKTRAALNA